MASQSKGRSQKIGVADRHAAERQRASRWKLFSTPRAPPSPKHQLQGSWSPEDGGSGVVSVGLRPVAVAPVQAETLLLCEKELGLRSSLSL